MSLAAGLAAWVAVSVAACAGSGAGATRPGVTGPAAVALAPEARTAPPAEEWRTYVPERCRGGRGDGGDGGGGDAARGTDGDDGDAARRGCRPRRIVVTSTDLEILEPISFVGNTAELAPGSHRMLDAVAQALLGNPSILLLEVRGHSDSLLHPEERAELARKRAEAVAAYLAAQGVDRSRLTTYGASDSELRYPADDARNRRVELVILERDE